MAYVSYVRVLPDGEESWYVSERGTDRANDFSSQYEDSFVVLSDDMDTDASDVGDLKCLGDGGC